MSAANVSIVVSVRIGPNYLAAIRRLRQLIDALFWAQWWSRWGTNGSRRSRALVVVSAE